MYPKTQAAPLREGRGKFFKGVADVRTLAEQEKANRDLKSLFYWNGFELRPKRCVECHYMPTEPEKHNCAAMDKQVRMPEMTWDCPMGQYGV